MDASEVGGYSLDTRSINRVLEMFVQRKECKMLCPFDRDGKMTLAMNNKGLNWMSVRVAMNTNRYDFFNEIHKSDYETIDILMKTISTSYSDNIVANVGEINEIRGKLQKLSSDIREIQNSLGEECADDESIENVISKIQEKIEATITAYNLEDYMPEAMEWLKPYWEKLEAELKYFIPTGFLLYNQFSKNSDVDMAPIMIEYCKSLEKELFEKMFSGYISNLIARNIDIKSVFPEAFSESNTKIFAEFLSDCTLKYREQPEYWKFELGKMRFVLERALAKKTKGNIIKDFRNYLNQIFDNSFFKTGFIIDLNKVNEIRNSCAHPSIIKAEDMEKGREIIREKLLLLLKYHDD